MCVQRWVKCLLYTEEFGYTVNYIIHLFFFFTQLYKNQRYICVWACVCRDGLNVCPIPRCSDMQLIISFTFYFTQWFKIKCVRGCVCKDRSNVCSIPRCPNIYFIMSFTSSIFKGFKKQCVETCEQTEVSFQGETIEKGRTEIIPSELTGYTVFGI